jgi:hypothetical protein
LSDRGVEGRARRGALQQLHEGTGEYVAKNLRVPDIAQLRELGDALHDIQIAYDRRNVFRQRCAVVKPSRDLGSGEFANAENHQPRAQGGQNNGPGFRQGLRCRYSCGSQRCLDHRRYRLHCRVSLSA